MKVITVITDRSHVGFNFLRLSSAINGLELVVLVSKESYFVSNRIKDDLLSNYLEKNVDDDEIIMFTDGNDTVFMSPEQEILDKFNKMGKDLVFSTETSCWPDVNLAGQYPNAGFSSYKYLNSGGFIGKAGLIKELLKDTSFDLENFKRSNQYIWAKRYFKYPEKIALDTACEIFYTFSPEVGNEYLPKDQDNNPDFFPYYLCMKQWFNSNFLVQNGRIYSKITQTSPCHAHFNGFSKWLFDYDMIDLVYAMIPNSRQTRFV